MKHKLVLLATLLSASFTMAESTWAAWQLNGTPVCTVADRQILPAIVSDGAGGAIIAWTDGRNGNADIYVSRIDPSGNPLWGANGVALCTAPGDQFSPCIVSDGAGGAIVAWEDARPSPGIEDIYAARINASGNPLWTANGVLVSDAIEPQRIPRITTDGAGGAIIAWSDYRTLLQFDIFARRIDASGNPLWASGGVAICVAPGDKDVPTIVADGAGGAILAWADPRGGFFADDIYAQRVNASGSVQWLANGVALCTASGRQLNPTAVSDGAAGAIVTWSDSRSGNFDVYARRIDGSGSPLWAANGVALCTASGDQNTPSIVYDGVGGAIVAWLDYRWGDGDIYARRVDASGNPQWVADGVTVCIAVGEQTAPSIVSDGSSGAVVTWLDGRGGTYVDIYAQRLAASGGGFWTFGGVALSTAPANKTEVVSASDGTGSVIAAWRDVRSDAGDIYAQRVEFKYGYWGLPEPTVDQVVDQPLDQGKAVVIQWTASQHDIATEGIISHYSIWRMPDVPGAAWEMVGEQPAIFEPEYSFICPTLSDATPGNPAIHHFKVMSHAPALGYEWDSNVMDGFSVDNLAPPPPTLLTAQRLATGGVQLHWNGASAPDLQDYAVYRWTQPGPVQFLMSSVDTTAIDADAPSTDLNYVVTARDVHDNESSPSNQASVDAVTGVGNTPSITSLRVLDNMPNPFTSSTTLRVGLPKASEVELDVFDVAGRRVRSEHTATLAAGWRQIAFDARDAAGQALPSGVYFYRVKASGATITRKMVITR